jgi:hypothetical protein
MKSARCHSRNAPSSASTRGFSLHEIAIYLGITAAVIAGVWSAYSAGDTSRRVRADAQTLAAIVQAVDRTHASRGTFEDLDQAAALADRVFPRQVISRDGTPRNAWGGPITVEGVSTAGLGSLARPADGFAITFGDLPPSACLRTAVQAGAGFHSVEVNGIPVSSGTQRERVDPNAAARACGTTQDAKARAPKATGHTVVFVAARQMHTRVVTCQPLPPETRPMPCPDGQLSGVPPHSPLGIVEGRSSFCEWPEGPPAWTAWEVIDDTCVPACSAPAPEERWDPRDQACPPNHVGSYTWEVLQRRTAYCPQPVGPSTWSEWADVVPEQRRDEVNTCALTCASQLPTPNPQAACGDTLGMPQQVDSVCPTDQTLVAPGSFYFVYGRTAVCLAPSGLPVWSPDWSPTAARCSSVPVTCAPSCAPVTNPETREQACPAGWTGSWTQTRTVTTPCPVGSPPIPTPWEPAAPPPGACTPGGPACDPPQPTLYRVLACPAGGTGTGIYEQRLWFSDPSTPPTCGYHLDWAEYGRDCVEPPPGCTGSPPGTTPACPSGGNQTGGTWSQSDFPGCSWSYDGGSCPPPPSCSNPQPSTTPTCPSGGNETGGTWTQAAHPGCTWTYSGGSCPPPPGLCPAGQAAQVQLYSIFGTDSGPETQCTSDGWIVAGRAAAGGWSGSRQCPAGSVGNSEIDESYGCIAQDVAGTLRLFCSVSCMAAPVNYRWERQELQSAPCATCAGSPAMPQPSAASCNSATLGEFHYFGAPVKEGAFLSWYAWVCTGS